MDLASTTDNLNQIIIQLLAVFSFPIVVSLIYRNNKSLVRTLNIGNKFSFRSFHSLYHLICVNRFFKFLNCLHIASLATEISGDLCRLAEL